MKKLHLSRYAALIKSVDLPDFDADDNGFGPIIGGFLLKHEAIIIITPANGANSYPHPIGA